MGKPDVVIRPSHPEWDERLDDYREAVQALVNQGVNAELADIPAPPSGSDLPSFIPEAFAVFVAVKVSDVILGTIIDELRRVLVGRARASWFSEDEKVKGVIYGPSGEVLHEFLFNGDGEDEAPVK